MKTRRLDIRRKLIFAFFALALLLSACAGSLTYYMTYHENLLQYGSIARSAAELASSEVDATAIARYLESGKDDSYFETEAQLAKIREMLGLRFLYVFVPSLTEEFATAVFDIMPSAAEADSTYSLGDYMGVDDVLDSTQEVLRSGLPATSTEITNGDFGYLLSAYVPVLDAQGKAHAVVGVDIDMTKVMSSIRVQTMQVAGATAAVILLFLALFVVFIDRCMVHPIKLLSADMASFDKNADELDIRRCDIRTGDEIELMADAFNQMTEDIKQYIGNLKTVTAEKERIAAELGVAKQIQASMLPSIFTFIPQRDEFEIFATMEPAKEVGGDFYDFYIVNGTHLVFVIADVSGKGVPAALFMVIAKTLIKNHALQGKTPADVLMNVNNQLCENNDAGMFVTVFLGMIELSTGKLTFSNAGHNQPLLRHEDAYAWFDEKPNFVLAGMENMRYRNYERQLSPGDRLYLYTDGVTEALDPSQQLFSDPRLYQTLNDSVAQQPNIHALLAQVRERIRVFADGAEQADDITMMAIDWLSPTK